MNTIEITTVGDGDPLKTTVAITQRGASPTLMLISDDSETIAHDADAASDITFTLGGGAERWTAAVIDEKNFLTLDPPEGDADATGFHVVTVENNRGEERTNTIVITTVGGTGDPVTDTITITQEEAPTILVTDPSDGIIAIGQNETALQTITFDVGGSATGWRATTSGANAVTFNSSPMGSLGTGELRVIPTENIGPERTTTIIISTTGQLGGAVTEGVTIIQQGPPPTLSLTSDRENTIAYDGKTVFEINFTVGGGATGWKADVRNGNREEFITLDRFGGDRGSNTLRVTSNENTGEERMNSIVITTVGGIGEKQVNITVTQEAVPTIKLTTNEIVNNIIYIANHEVTPQTIRFNIGGSATGWTARSDQSFVMLDKESGDSGTGIELIARPVSRNDGVEREAMITISTAGHLGQPLTAEVTIRHRGAPPTIMLMSDDSETIAHDAVSVSDITFIVGGGATGWKAKVIGEDKFLTLVDSAGNAGTNTIRVTAAKNTGKARMNTIVITTVGGRRSAVTETITVTQAAGLPTIMLTSGNTVDVANTATTSSDSIEIRFIVGGEETGWTAAVDADFVTLGKTMGSSGSATLKAAVTENMGGERTATITLTAMGGTETANTTVTITQSGILPTLILTSGNTVDVANTATTSSDSIAIMFTVGGGATGWEATVDEGFVTLDKTMGSSGSATLKVAVTENVGVERSVVIAITTIGHVGSAATATVTITQAAAPFIQTQSNTHSGSITVTTQEEVDALATTLANIDTIDGNLIIGYASGNSRSNITDLTPLSNITHITGNLYIQRNGALVNLNDLTHLQSVGGIFWVSHNRSLETLGSFDSLQNVNGLFFRVSDNDSLTTLGTFDSLQNIQGSFEIYDNESLGTLGSFNKLNSIGSFFEVRGNASLISLGQFSSLTHIGSSGELDFYPNLSILVEHNPNLVLCDFLDDFLEGGTHAVEGNIRVANNASECNTSILLATELITTDKDDTTYSFDVYANVRWKLSKAENADWITSLSLGNNTADPSTITSEDTATITIDHTRILGHATRTTTLTLTAIDENDVELASPAPITIVFRQWGTRYTGDIRLTNQAEVDAFSSHATAIFGNLIIGYSNFTSSRSDITHLNSLSNITHVMGNVNIQRNGQLVNLNDLNNLQLIGGYFQMLFNDSLTTLGNFSELQSIGGYFKVRINNALQTLGNFSGLNSIENYVEIEENPSLNNLGNFNHLQNIGGYVDVARNDSLNFLGDFNHLQNIGSYFSVNNNPLLQTLGNFNHLQNIEKHFYVNNNVALFSLGSFSSLTDIGIGSAYVFSVDDYISNDVSIVVEGNSSLSDCYTLADLFPGGDHAVSGGIYINDNALGCNSGDEIIAAVPHTIMLTSHTDGDSIAIAYDEVVAQTIMFSIGGGATGWTSDITGDDFITLDTDMNVAQDTGVAITVRATPTDENTGTDERIAVITFTTTGGGPAASATVTIRQAGIPPVYVGDITLINQEQVDTIRNTLGSSTAIRGNLIIGSSIDITDLSPLNFLTKITGNLEISNNSMLEDVGEFPVLDSIGGYFEIRNNASLDTIGSFPVLRSIGGYFRVRDNNQLITVGSFPSLETVGGSLDFQDNPKITMIGEYLILRSIGDQFRVVNCEQLQSLNGFPSLTHVGETFFVYRNDSLKIVENFPVLTTIGGNLQIDQNDVLRSIEKFPVLASVGTDLRIALNPLLESIGNFSVLTTIGGNLQIDQNNVLRSIGDFSVLTTIGGNLQIDQNNVLRSIGDFSVLTTIGGNLQIQNNDLLGDCCGLLRLLSGSIITGSTTIQNNAVGCDSESQINTPLTLISSNEIIEYDNTDSIAIDFTLGCGVTGWTSTITYTPANANFITLSSTGSTTQTGVITIMATPTENMGGERTATITLTTTGSTGTADTTITITQAAGPPTLTLSRTTANVDATAQMLTVGVTLGGSAESWGVTEVDDENFITTTKVGDDSLRITILENSSTNSREAALIFTTTGGTGEATQTLVITQLSRGLEPPTLTLSRTTASVDATAQMLTVGVTLGGSAESWNVTETDDENFITISKVGDDSLRITILENSSTDSREATLTFTTAGAVPQTLVITQAGGVPTLSITETSLFVDFAAETANIEIMSNTNWRVTTAALFVDSLIFTSTEGSVVTAVPVSNNITLEGTGSGTLSVVYKANTEAARVADITLTRTGGTDIDIALMQAAGPPTVMLTSDDTETIAHDAETASDITFEVGGGATDWWAGVIDRDGYNNFLILDKTSGSAGLDTIKVITAVNTGEERVDTVVVGTGGEGEATDTIIVTQDAGPPIFTLTSDDAETIAHDAETASDITFEVGGGASGWMAEVIDGDSDNNFVMLSKLSGSAGLDTIKVTTTVNTGVARVDTVVGTGGEGEATDTIIVTQEAVPTIEITDPIDKMITIDHNVTDAQTITFNVGGSATGWTVSSDHDSVALSLTSGSSGEGIKVTATFKENKDVERNAKITLMTTGQLGAGKTAEVTITQKGSPDAPKLDVTTPSGLTDVAYTATSDSIEIMFTVEKALGWESMISYGVGEDEFITLSETANVDQTGEVRIKAAVTENEGVERSATITLSTTGQGGFSAATREITIIQRGKPNQAPTAITLSNNTINENEETGTVIGILNSMDEDDTLMNGTYTYTLETTYEDVFQIVGDTLKTKISLNYEENPNYTIQITTNDGNNGIYSGDLIIRVLNINDSPTAITLSNHAIDENVSIGSTIGTLQTVDEDENENHHYVLSGVDGGSFRIVGNNRLETNDLFDYETKTNYELTLTTTDNGGSRWTESFTVTVNDVNETPINITLDNNTITENSVEGTVIGTLSTLDPDDPDNNDTYNYSIEGTASDIFQIVGNELQVKISPNYEEKSSYTIRITTRDQGDNTLTEDVIITIENTNDAPREIILSKVQISENAKADTLLGILTSIDDDDPFMRNTYTYTLDTMYQDIFEIIGDEFRVKKSLNYEEKSSFTIQITTEDEQGGMYDATFVISVKDEDDVPTSIRLTKDSVSENQPIGTSVGILETIDEDENETYVYTLEEDNGSFFIENDTLKTGKTLNFEERDSIEIRITSRDHAGRMLISTFVIHIMDEDDAPHAIILSPDNRIAEGLGKGTVVGKFITLDEDDPEMKNQYDYVLGGQDSDLFSIIQKDNIYQLITDFVFVYDSANNSYRVSITARDFTNSTEFLDTLAIEVTKENPNPPTGITLSGTTVAENAVIGTTIGTLETMDADASDEHRYEILGSLSDQFQIVEKRNNNGTFTFELQTSVELNYEERSTYEINLSTDDGGDGGIYDTTFVISVQDRNDAPTGIQVFNALDEPVTSVPENSSAITLVGILRAVDEDSVRKETNYNDHSYRLGDTDVPFSIRDDTLWTKESFDFEDEGEKSYTINVEVTDNNNGSNDGSFSLVITVEDVNEPPVNITLSKNTIAENKRVGTVIGTLRTEDVDSMDSHTYKLSGEHANFFRIDGKELKTKKVFNYETDSINYEISITTKDQGESTFIADFMITLVDVNDAPTLITLTKDSVAENQKDAAIGVLSSVDEDDEDRNNEYIYSSDNGLFTISKDTLKTSYRLDYEEFPIHHVTITTKDGQGGVFSQPFLIKVTNENDRPVDIELNADSIAENIDGRVVIGIVSTVDEDINDEHVYTVDNTAFSFDGNKLITHTPFDYEAQDSYTIVITSTDGIDDVLRNFTIYVTDVNDAPSAIQLTNTSVAENDSIGTLVGILSTIDDDLLGGNPRGDTHLYRLVNDNDSESKFFRISGDRLEIDTTFNYETQSSYDIVLVTTDRDGVSLQQSFTITIEDVNDVPTSLSLSNDVVKEKEEAYTVIGILSTTDEDDPNMDSVYTYSIDNDIFTIDNDTLKTNRELDFETQSEYLVAITTVDGRGGTRTEDFTLKVSNVNEPPTAIALSNHQIAENNPADTLIGILSTTDEDLLNNNQSNDTHSYTLVEDTDKNIFTIQADRLKRK